MVAENLLSLCREFFFSGQNREQLFSFFRVMLFSKVNPLSSQPNNG